MLRSLFLSAADDGTVQEEEGEPEQYSNDVPTKLRVLNNMVNQYIEEGRTETCVPLCKKAYADIEKELGEGHPDLATVLCILSAVYRLAHTPHIVTHETTRGHFIFHPPVL